MDKEVKYGDDKENFTTVETPFTSTANQARQNIQNEDDDELIIPVIIENSTKSQNELTFLVNGEANDELKDGNVNLFLEKVEEIKLYFNNFYTR